MIYAYEMLIDNTSLLSTFNLGIMSDKDRPDGVGTKTTHVFNGRQYVGENNKENLVIPITLGKAVDGQFSYLNAEDRDAIDFFLTSKSGLQKFEFVQDDMIGKYYEGKVNNIKWLSYGNQSYLLEFDIETNSPYAQKGDIIRRFDLTGGTNTITLNNPTHGDKYNQPVIKITMQSTGSNVSIKNITDNNRTLAITGLVGQEVITIDCYSGAITSSTGLNKKKNCNLKYTRLYYGNNQLEITGNVASIEFTYKNESRVGGCFRGGR